jgi:GTP cyclohydrolase I
MAKNDPTLGAKVAQHLQSLSIETPILQGVDHSKLISACAGLVASLGLDTADDSINATPTRLAEMYANELCYGLNYDNFPKCTVIENKMRYDELVIERDIKVHSMCEHHFVPFIGVAHIAYLPSTKVLGLSKLNRVTDFFCRRPQVQERLTEQVAAALSFILGTEDVAVIISAEHMCVKLRGVQDQCSSTVTSKMLGKFREKPELRMEFLSLAGR